jgi:hypothetical protein
MEINCLVASCLHADMYGPVTGCSTTCRKGKRNGKLERKEIVKRLSQDFIRPRQQVKTRCTDRRGSDVTARLEEPNSCRVEGTKEVKQNHSKPLNAAVQTRKKLLISF